MKVKCGLESCDVMITLSKRQIPHIKRGNHVFCCVAHKKYFHHKKWDKKRHPQGSNKNEKQKAREFAVLNCVLYRECNLGITMNCHKCQKKIIEIGAWRREPGTLYHTQEDLHVICLPSAGRGE